VIKRKYLIDYANVLLLVTNSTLSTKLNKESWVTVRFVALKASGDPALAILGMINDASWNSTKPVAVAEQDFRTRTLNLKAIALFLFLFCMSAVT